MGAPAVVICNDHGEVIVKGAWPKLYLLDAKTAEAEALRHGLQLIESTGCSPVIIESDCLGLIEASMVLRSGVHIQLSLRIDFKFLSAWV
jgi:hypothetical protein